MMASLLIRLGRIWGDDALVARGEGVLRLLAPAMERVPRAFSWALCALDLHLSPPRELAIVGDVRSDVARAALAGFAPETVVAVGPSDEVPLLAGKGLVDGEPAVYVCERFACRAPVTRPRSSARRVASLGSARRMATTEITGAEEVAWDLSDLYEGIDDPRIDADVAQAEADAAAFRERYHGKVAELDAPSLAEAVAEHERIESAVVRPLTYAHLVFATNMADPRAARSSRGSARRRPRSRRSSSSSRSNGPPRRTTSPSALLADPALDHWRHHLALAAQVPARTSSPSRRSGSSRRRPSPASRRGRGSTRSSSARSASRSTARRCRSRRRWRGCTTRTATRGARLPRRSPRRSAPGSGRGRSSSTRSSRTSRSTTGCAATRPGSRPATSRTRRRTRPSTRSSRRRRPATTSRSATTASRRGCSGIDRLDALRPLRAGLDGRARRRRGTRLGGSSSTRTASSRTRPARSSRASSTTSWIDAPVRPDKRTGAFCATTVPGVHPYILMNYTGDRRSILTLAHELGHGLHGVLAQPLGLFNSSTPLTTAETASVFGEALTFELLLADEDDPRRRLDLLTGRIEDAIATTFRQIAMNRFEHAVAHRAS